MKIMNKKMQLITTKEVLNQMRLAEECMNKQGLSWTANYIGDKENFERVDWLVPKTKSKNERNFSFHNNGKIEFNKMSLAKRGNRVSYSTVFDVLSSDFKIRLVHTTETTQDIIDFKLENNQLLITFDGVGKGVDLETNEEITKSGNRDYYNVNLCNEARDKAMEMIRIIRGELPLPGLVDRINFGLSILSNEKYNSKGRK